MSERLEDYEYDLPPELIAQEPLPGKDQSRLFLVNRGTGSFTHKSFFELPDILQKGDLLVVNDTRVLPSRLITRRQSGGTIKILLLKPYATNTALWEAMVTPIKRLKIGEELSVIIDDLPRAKVIVRDLVTGPDGFKRIIVDLGAKENVFDLLSQVGFAPLPPYIHRNYQEGGHRGEDLLQYQTVFASAPGAVAAPTAGLHFTQAVLKRLHEKEIEVKKITLHVGPGTFKPIEDSLESHTIEEELYSVPEETAEAVNKARAEGRRVFAVGTTSLRTLETAGVSGKLLPAQNQLTSLYVKPGHQFKIVDGLLTNFHLSKSSLLVLAAAFAGRELILGAYQDAIAQRYRFYSYGDAMLII